MAELFDSATGELVEVPDDELDTRYRTGQYALPDAERYNVRGGDGRIISVAREELNAALEGGFRLATGSQAREQRFQDEYESTGAQVRTAAEAGARGLTLGLSDEFLADLPVLQGEGQEGRAAAQEGLRERRDRNPVIATVGEVGGALAPTLLSGGAGGAGVLGRVGRAAGAALEVSPAALLTRAGAAAERAVGGALGESLLARTAARTVGGAVEGAGAGLGFAITESALEDTELTAERLLFAMGTGAVLGGGASAGLGAAGDVVGAGTRRLLSAGSTAARRFGRASREAVEALYQRAAGPDAVPLGDGVAEIYGRLSSLATGADEQAIRQLTELTPAGQAARRLVTNADEVVESAAREGRTLLDTAERTARVLMNESQGRFKLNAVIPRTRGLDPGTALARAEEVLGVIGGQADEMLTDASTWGARAAVSRIRSDLDTVATRIRQAAASGDETATARIFQELDGFKRRMGPNARPGRQLAGSAADESALGRIRQWYESTRQHLEDGAVYGEAAALQQDANRAWVGALNGLQGYERGFMTEVGRDGFNPVLTHDPGKLQAFLGNIGRARNDIAEESIASHIEGQRGLIEAIARNFDLSPEARKALAEARSNAERLDRWLARTREDVGTINRFRSLQQAGAEANALGFGAAGAAAGGLVAGAPGAAAGAAVAGAIVRPDQAVRVLAAIERIQRGAGARMTAAVRAMLGAGTDVTRRTSSAIARTARSSSGPARRAASRAITISAFDEVASRVVEAQANPTERSRRVAASIADVSGAAPMVATTMAAHAERATAFLGARLPPGLRPIHGLQPHLARSRVPDSEKARFLRYVRAVEDPMSIIDELEGGELSRESVEALRELYPSVYADLQRVTLETVTELGDELTYRQRLQLGVLLDIPTDPSLQPERLAMLQALFAAPPTDAPPLTPPPAGSSVRAEQMSSETDSFERRRRGA